MFSPRGVLMLAHSVHDAQVLQRHIHANRIGGVDNEWLTPQRAKAFCPPLDIGDGCRYPVVGAALQRRAGVARHDAVAWGYARAASRLGVDIIQGCEASGFRFGGRGEVVAVETSRGAIDCERVGVVTAGHSSVVLGKAGFRMPIESYPLQALVSEPVKPILPCVVMSNAVHAYISQSDKGELVIGAGTDQYVSYTQSGGLQVLTHAIEAVCELFPVFRRLRMLRSWAGTVDVTPDRSPILGATPVEGLYVNCGWGTGGFKATPAARSRGIEVLSGHAVVATRGRQRVREIIVRDLACHRRARKLACDALLMAGGWTPTVHLFSQARGRLQWSPAIRAFVPAGPVRGMVVAGACRGIFATPDVIADGEHAGHEAACAAGRHPPRAMRVRRSLSAPWPESIGECCLIRCAARRHIAGPSSRARYSSPSGCGSAPATSPRRQRACTRPYSENAGSPASAPDCSMLPRWARSKSSDPTPPSFSIACTRTRGPSSSRADAATGCC